MDLPKPDVVRCFFEQNFDAPLPAMELRWNPDSAGAYERVWHLPESVTVKGAAPQRFGVNIHRIGADSYKVRVLWNRLCLTWESLTRRQIMTSSLAPVLESLGTDVWYLLNQPAENEAQSQAA